MCYWFSGQVVGGRGMEESSLKVDELYYFVVKYFVKIYL